MSKDLSLMFNANNPSIYYIVEAGRSINVTVPGVYNVIPLNLDKIVAGYSNEKATMDRSFAAQDKQIPQSLLEMKDEIETLEAGVTTSTSVQKPITLFTQNLNQLLFDTRTQ